MIRAATGLTALLLAASLVGTSGAAPAPPAPTTDGNAFASPGTLAAVPVADPSVVPGASGSGASRTSRGSSTVRTAPRGRWTWPLNPIPRVVDRFDPPTQRWLPGHRGVDLATEAGADVLAADDGVIAFAGVVAGKPVLSIDHANGLRSTYEPVAAFVGTGTSVSRAQVVGTLASADGHCAPAACLHWGARRGKDYLDPLSLVGARPAILLPLR